MHRCSLHVRVSENMALGQVVTKLVGNVVTVYGARNKCIPQKNIKVKMLTMHRGNIWNSLNYTSEIQQLCMQA